MIGLDRSYWIRKDILVGLEGLGLVYFNFIAFEWFVCGAS